MNPKTIKQFNYSNRLVINYRDRILLKEFNLLLTKNIQSSRSVKYYADLLAISAKKLNSLTKIFHGVTAKKFIEKRIISDSKNILLNTSDTVKQISYSMGFTEPTNFNKFFKKLTTITPQQYREKQINRSVF